MFFPAVFFASMLILSAYECAPLHDSELKAVDLAYTCMHVTANDNKSDKPAILLLHGLGSSKESWTGIYQVLALKTGRRVCVADLRNHGDSPWDDRSDVAAMAADIAHLVDLLKERKVVILGHSLGGKVAVHTALNYPEKVDGIIVEDMRPNGVPEKALKEVQFFMMILKESANAIPPGADEKTARLAIVKFINEQLRKINSVYTLDEKVAAFLPIRCSEGKCQWKVNVKLADRVRNDPKEFLTESKGVFNGPALFIYGTKSPFKVGDTTDEIYKLFPKAKVVPIEGASHVIHGLFPKFMEEVFEFLQ